MAAPAPGPPPRAPPAASADNRRVLDLSGTSLAGYRIEALIGRGGMGAVYRAHQPALDRMVALKVIAEPFASDTEYAERFRREAVLAASLEHPHVVPIYECGSAGGVVFLAMRLIPGEDLGAVLRRDGPLAAAVAVRLAGQVASALDAGHAAGLVHRDVKPQNVLVAEQDGAVHAYLTDFGVALRGTSARLTATGVLVGTPGYLAPEVIRGGPATAASDTYALGCVLYEALTGTPPFARADPLLTVAAQLNDPAPSAPGVPARLDDVLRRAMSKHPGDRFQRASEMARAATLAVEGGGRERVAEPDGLIGRDADVRAITELLTAPGPRIVSVTGPGGIGKTTLALAVADGLRPRFRDGARVATLAALQDPDLLPAVIASALEVGEPPSDDAIGGLAGALSGREQLLVLDNFESLIEAAPLVARLAAEAPGLRLLVTSRAPLRVAGEHVLDLEPLSVPPVTARRDAESLATESAAARLFIARAKEARPGLAFGERDAEEITAICRRLDGMPLALELAAARVRHLPLAAIARRLDHGLTLLSRGRSDLPSRHQTLRATIDSSYEQLAPEHRELLARIGVFAGGFDLEAAEAVCGTDGVADVLDGLSTLIDNSLVRVAADGRYSMLQVIREYALERLREGVASERVRDAHLDHYLGLAEQCVPVWRGRAMGPETVEVLAREHDNLRAALDWAEHRGDGVKVLRIAIALRLFWFYGGFRREGTARVEAGLALAGDLDARTRAQALATAGGLRLGMPGEESRARARLLEALALCESTDQPEVEFSVVAALSILSGNDGPDSALKWALRALEVALRSEVRANVAVASSNLSDIALERGDLAAAEDYARRSLEALAGSDELGLTAIAQLNLAQVLFHKDELALAAVHAGEGLRSSRVVNDREDTANALLLIAALAAASGRPEDGARLAAAGDRVHEDCGTAFQPVEAGVRRELISRLTEQLGDARLDEVWVEAQAAPLDDALALALGIVAALAP
jgi:non-specific serine/threonine protein kinase